MTFEIPAHYYKLPKISSLPQADDIFKLLNISKTEDENLRIFDHYEDEGLILVNYLEPQPNTYHLRGVVVYLDDMTIVARSFLHTPELDSLDDPYLRDFDFKNENVTLVLAKEGPLLRAFKSPKTGNVYLATHRKINGKKSKWGGKTFGEQLIELNFNFTELESKLNLGECLIFLLNHLDNRVVCKVDSPSITLIQAYSGIFESSDLLNNYSYLNVNSTTPVPTKIESYEQLIASYSATHSMEHCGLILTFYNEGYVAAHLKILPARYSELRELRGTDPNIKMRWIALYNESREKELEEFFIERKPFFLECHKMMANVMIYLEDKYYERKNSKEFISYETNLHLAVKNIFRELHSNPGMKVRDAVVATVSKLDPSVINKISKLLIPKQKNN